MLHVCRAFPEHVVLLDHAEGRPSEARDSEQLSLAAEGRGGVAAASTVPANASAEAHAVENNMAI